MEWEEEKDDRIEKRGWGFFSLLSLAKRFSLKSIVSKEISRARRHGQQVGILVVEIKGPSRRCIHKLLPGIPLSAEWSNLKIRGYDHLERSGLFRYTLLLPQTDLDGVEEVKSRIINLSKEMGWTQTSMGMALFPRDGQQAEELLERARGNLYLSKKTSVPVFRPRLTNEDFRKLI